MSTCAFKPLVVSGLFLLGASFPNPALSAEESLDRLVAAYPDFLSGHDGVSVIFKDGTKIPVSDGRENKSFDEKLKSPTIRDQMSIPYP